MTKGSGNPSKPILLYLPVSYMEGLEELVRRGFYPNRAEAIRVAVCDLLKDELWFERRRT